MPGNILEFRYLTGLLAQAVGSYVLDIYTLGDVLITPAAGLAISELTNCKTRYQATYDGAGEETGHHTAIIRDDGDGSFFGTAMDYQLDNTGGLIFTDLPNIISALTNGITISASASVLSSIDSGGTIEIVRGDYTTFALTGLGSLAGRTGEKVYFTVRSEPKESSALDLLDEEAYLQITETTGAVRADGEAATASHASLTVDDEDAGDITLIVEHDITQSLPLVEGYYYDVQWINASGKPVTLTKGRLRTVYDVTRRNS